jgi:hypothetical protein
MNTNSPEYKKQQLKEMHNYAMRKGGKCLATEYINSHYKYLWEDSEGNQWLACWYNYKQRGGWSKKAGYEKNAKALIKYTICDINEKFAKPRGGKLMSTEYKNTKTKLEWEDSKGRIFLMSLEHVIAGQWSPHEKKERIGDLKRKYDYEFCVNLAKSYSGVLITEYLPKITTSTKLMWKDKNGETFVKTLGAVLSEKKLLAPKKSMGEYEIAEFLKEHALNFTSQCRKTLGTGFELDFVIPDKNIGIEYHGLKWHTEAKKGKDAHLNKLTMAKTVNLKLIQVFEHEWRDRNFQVKSFLTSKLGLNKERVFARKCELKEVSKKEAIDFLNKNHIQGSGKFDIAFGLYYSNELTMLVAFGKHHRGGSGVVLTRCVSKFNTTVVGGLSRLCKHAKAVHGSFITWVDLRWSDGSSWIANNWNPEEILKPDYFYYNENTKKIVSKQSRRKSKCPPPAGLTEKQFAEIQGFMRVYDAGKLRLRY